jgi:hypothetical protein
MTAAPPQNTARKLPTTVHTIFVVVPESLARRRRKLTIIKAWRRARAIVFGPEVWASPAAPVPYDLRHAALSTWLNAGIPPAEVAAWAG